jgi:hypothetical protein
MGLPAVDLQTDTLECLGENFPYDEELCECFLVFLAARCKGQDSNRLRFVVE